MSGVLSYLLPHTIFQAQCLLHDTLGADMPTYRSILSPNRASVGICLVYWVICVALLDEKPMVLRNIPDIE